MTSRKSHEMNTPKMTKKHNNNSIIPVRVLNIMPTRILVQENDDNDDNVRVSDNSITVMSHCSDDDHHHDNNRTAGTSGMLWWNEHVPTVCGRDRPLPSQVADLHHGHLSDDNKNSTSTVDSTPQNNHHVGIETQQLLLGFLHPHHSTNTTTGTTKHHHHSPIQKETNNNNNMDENDPPKADDDPDQHPAPRMRPREESSTKMVLEPTTEPERIPLLPIQQQQRPPRPPRIMGRNEIEYREQYQAVVARVVAVAGIDPVPPPYQSWTRDEQERAQQFVTNLLQRLGIMASGPDDERGPQSNPAPHDTLPSLSSPIPNTHSISSSSSFHKNLPAPKDPNYHLVDTSLDLFASPVAVVATTNHNNPPPNKLDAPPLGTTTTSSASSSVEITRAARHVDNESDATATPPPDRDDPYHQNNNNKKRYASTSGKRGADLVRLRRRREENDDDDDDMVVFHPPSSPSQFLVRAIDRLSVMDDHRDIFSSSQSPIVAAAADTSPFTTTTEIYRSPATTNRHHHQMDHRRTTSMESIEADGISFQVGNDDDNNNSDGSSISCDRESTMSTNPVPPHRGNDYDSLVETTMLLDTQQVHWDYDHTLVKNAPTDVRLRQGETIRYPKLTVPGRSRTRPTGSTIAPIGLTQSYPDPFRGYDDTVQRQLNQFYAKLIGPNRRSIRRRNCAILSMAEQQVTDVVLKLHLDHGVMDDSTEHAHQNVPFRGKTLIVTRSKDELDLWRRTFREGSGLSIVNHASMPLAQRKHPTLSAKLVHYDIVLSTYDAIKSPDMAIKVDTTTGLAIAHADHTTSDGWYTTTTTATKQSQHNRSGDIKGKNQEICKALSAVHKLHWSRIILVDVLGRKGYLTKGDTTARLQAVRALNAHLRWAFFVVSDMSGGDQTNTTKNAKSAIDSAQTLLCERNTLLSLASTLRHPASGDDKVDIDQIRQEIVHNFDM